VVKRIPHKWHALLFGDGGRGTYYQVWQSLKYDRLQMYVYGKRGNHEGSYRRFAIAGWHPEEIIVDEIEEAIRVCREDLYCDYRYPNKSDVKLKNDTRALVLARAKLRQQVLRRSNPQDDLGAPLCRSDSSDKSKESHQSNQQLRKPVRVGKGQEKVRLKGTVVNTVRRRESRRRVSWGKG